MTIAASLFSHVLDTYLEQRMQSPCTKTCKKKSFSFKFNRKNFFMLILEGHLRSLRNSLSFPNSRHLGEVSVSRLRPLKRSLGTALARKFAVPVRWKETLFCWIFAQTIMMLCEFAWTFCLFAFSISGSTGRHLFLSVFLFFFNRFCVG